ncbi:TonB-dependent siderophore receptor [Chryseobacterium sp. A301]
MRKSIIIAAVLGSMGIFAQQKKDSIPAVTQIEEVNLFGASAAQPEGLEMITRMPLKTRDQIQSISVLSSKVIEDLGGLSVTDVVKNIPGVTQFASYGGTKESMTIRGYRGVPVLKNGVRMDSDFRTSSMLTDMQGVESIQVIKGSAAVTQGVASGLGDAGGVINIVTKKPHFINKGSVGVRYGSWDLYRGFLDVQRVLDPAKKVGVRLNASYQNNQSFRDNVQGERVYINPSVAYRISDRTEVSVEMDYFNSNLTPDRGTVNLGPGSENHIYEMPKGNFLGFKTDNSHTTTINLATNFTHRLSDKLKLRAAYYNSSYTNDNISSSLGKGSSSTGYAILSRSLGRSEREDNNQTLQFDFIGQDVYTGSIKHTFQTGFDWTQSNVDTYSYATKSNVDQINVLEKINNTLPAGVNLDFGSRPDAVNTKNSTYGLIAQDVITINPFLKAVLGLRYSHLNGLDAETVKDAWNPTLGLMVSPRENMNIFASYTSTTSLRGANNPLEGGGIVGSERTDQVEAGLKSDWFQEKLRFNVTLFHMNTDNLSYTILNEQGQSTGLYGLAGKLVRSGVDLELIGKVMTNLQVMAGYSYLDAKYKESPAYMDDSAPMNTPSHTANGWVNYKFNEGTLRGLDFGVGAYFVGARPVDNYTKKTIQSTHVNSVEPGVKPFELDSYATLEAQVGYQMGNLGLRVFLNNLTDVVNYSSYFRGGYLDQIQPRNASVQLTYKF